MAIILAINDQRRTGFRYPPPRGWVTAKCVKEPPESLAEIFCVDASDIDAADESVDDLFLDEELLAGILEFEEEREQLGILGRWPFWQIRTWSIAYPDWAERVAIALILVAGVTLGVLWHVLFGARE